MNKLRAFTNTLSVFAPTAAAGEAVIRKTAAPHYINDGLITVCGSVKAVDWDGWKIDYDVRYAGMTTVTVPEPATIALLGLGGLVLLRRRRR